MPRIVWIHDAPDDYPREIRTKNLVPGDIFRDDDGERFEVLAVTADHADAFVHYRYARPPKRFWHRWARGFEWLSSDTFVTVEWSEARQPHVRRSQYAVATERS